MTVEQLRRTYTSWAPYYDVTHAWTLPYRQEARLVLDVQRGERVLDLACGTGLNFSHLRERVGGEGHAIGVDLSADMLAIANRRIARHTWLNVETREADAQRRPFPDNRFDKAICTFAMNIIPDYARAIAETKRILAPGGRFVVLDVKLGGGIFHSWLGPVARVIHAMHVCGVDITHKTIDEMRWVFSRVQIREHWGGFVYIAEGIKGS